MLIMCIFFKSLFLNNVNCKWINEDILFSKVFNYYFLMDKFRDGICINIKGMGKLIIGFINF